MREWRDPPIMSTETLYKTYQKPLFSLAYRMLGSVMDAEDIVQEAFLAYDQLPDSAAIQYERAFLYKIVTNRCLDLLRSSAKKTGIVRRTMAPRAPDRTGRSEWRPIGCLFTTGIDFYSLPLAPATIKRGGKSSLSTAGDF